MCEHFKPTHAVFQVSNVGGRLYTPNADEGTPRILTHPFMRNNFQFTEEKRMDEKILLAAKISIIHDSVCAKSNR